MECHSPGLRIHLKIYDHCIMLFSQYGTYGIWNKAMEICVPYTCPSSLVTRVPLTILSVIYLRNLHLLSLLLHSLHICRDPGFHKETIPPLTWNESFFKCCDMAAKRPAGKRRVSILAGAIVSDYQDRVDDRESLLNAKANLLDHFFVSCMPSFESKLHMQQPKTKKDTVTSSSDPSNRRFYITSSCKPPRTLKPLAEMKGCTE